MGNETDYVRTEILKLVDENGPIGWYSMERKLRVPRSDFREGYTLMSYLDELEETGFVTRNDEGKYIGNR